MTRSSGPDNLVPFDPEIEKSAKRIRKKKKQHKKMEERALAVENDNDTYGAYLQPKYTQQLSCIHRPDIDRNKFEFQPTFISMLSSLAFRGRPNEDPIPHLTRFKLLCQSVKTVQGVTDESLMLMAFPFSLMDAALEWLYTLPPDSIFSWDQMQENYVANNPYSNTYNPGWRNHPNFLYKNSSNALNAQHNNFGGSSIPGSSQGNQSQPRNAYQHQNPAPQHYRAPRQPQQNFGLTPSQSQKTDAHLKLVDNQIAQLAASVPSRPQGSLPGNPEANPREHCNAISLRSGKELANPAITSTEKGQCSNSVPIPLHDPIVVEKSTEISGDEERDVYIPPPPRPPAVPFPQRLMKTKEDNQFARFADMVRKLEITMPFHEVITQMPSYAHFLKDILTKKRVIEKETITLNPECSAILQHDLPPKMSDPGSFSIPCKLGNISIDRALCDLGASVSLLPLSIYKKLNVGELKPTRMALQLADRSIKYPLGILEDVPLKVGDYYVPVDFVVLDMDEDAKISIILGRPFLNTADAIVHGCSISTEPQIHEYTSFLDGLDEMPCNTVVSSFDMDRVDILLQNIERDTPVFATSSVRVSCNTAVSSFDTDHVKCLRNFAKQDTPVHHSGPARAQLDTGVSSVNSDRVESRIHLQYAFLGLDSTYPVIVNAALDDLQLERLLTILRDYRKAIG
ncbi:PREDICTED: uncharacterized protein LOC104804936 [Tarenaya hassleriana]|uniref:uncharacterized protein LOC104804936 n=1 Tax=Tarenaya hassleriana TaxID=28532 RepID=UPI00053C0AF8|nr:PREDICTED: uncharacterized protein LOC104804936 [Tarenaya hassleriana]